MRLNNRGAASVLVLLLIIVLATFGAIALTTGYSNKNMVSRSVSYFKDYYEVDTACEAMLCSIDQCLLSAHEQAIAYIEQYYPDFGLPSAISPADVPESFIALIRYNSDNSTIQAKKVLEIYRRLYFYYAYTELCRNSSINGYRVTLSEKYTSGLDFLSTDYQISQNECPMEVAFSKYTDTMRIDAGLGIISPRISFVLENSINLRYNIQITYNGSSNRYKILSWMQKVPDMQPVMEPMYDGKAQ